MLKFKKYYAVILFIYALLQFTCSNNPPIWVEKRPDEISFWHGIGFASKEIDNPKEIARERAIYEISSQIKISISSELDIVVNDFNGSVESAISSITKSRVQLLLPKLELIDVYETKDGTYFYVRLNKEKYKTEMRRLRQNAIATAINYIEQADKVFTIESLIWVQKAFNEIRAFNDEPIEISYNEEKFNLYSLIKEKSSTYKKRILIEASMNKKSLVTLLDQDNTLILNVMDKVTKESLDAVPIKLIADNLEYSLISNPDGIVYHIIPTFLKPRFYNAYFEVDTDRLLSTLKKNNKVLFDAPLKSSFSIEILKVKAMIYSSEKNLNKPLENVIIKPMVESSMNTHVNFVDENPEIKIYIEANTETKSVRNDNSFPYFVYGTATVVFENVFSGERFFNSNITNVKGADFNSQVIAGIRSYEKLSKKLVEQLESEILLVQSDNDK